MPAYVQGSANNERDRWIHIHGSQFCGGVIFSPHPKQLVRETLTHLLNALEIHDDLSKTVKVSGKSLCFGACDK
jgi:hypothetical protein